MEKTKTDLTIVFQEVWISRTSIRGVTQGLYILNHIRDALLFKDKNCVFLLEV